MYDWVDGYTMEMQIELCWCQLDVAIFSLAFLIARL